MAATQRFGLLGRELSYSFSKEYFTKKFETSGQDAVYENYELKSIDEFAALDLEGVFGLNVTIPYKEAIIPFLDEIDPIAEEIGAVNTVKFTPDKIVGYNTDAFGFRESLRPFLKGYHHQALILGTGGASKAVAYVLRQLGLEYRLVSRSPKGRKQVAYAELNAQALRLFPLIINTTPLGTAPAIDEMPDLPYEALAENNFLYDLIYNPSESAFLRHGKEHGAQILNGRRMLELQAEESWRIWNSSD